MRKFLFIFLIFQYSVAQDGLEPMRKAFEINSTVLKYPKHFSNPENLANRIRHDFTLQRDQAQALYCWMAFNIRYDIKKRDNPPKFKRIKYKTQEEKLRKEKKMFDKEVGKTLRSRKGICGDYAQAYFAVANLIGLNCEINSGSAKTEKYDIGKKRAVIDHAWNSVLIDGEWKLIDVTWGAGFVDEEEKKFIPDFTLFYFDTPKESFFANHYPDKGNWHDFKINKKDFLDAPLLDTQFIGNIKIIEPKSGIITIKKGEKFKFRIAGLDTEAKITYSLKDETLGPADTITTTTDGITEFEITIDKSIGRYLMLFVDGIRVATFRINQLK